MLTHLQPSGFSWTTHAALLFVEAGQPCKDLLKSPAILLWKIMYPKCESDHLHARNISLQVIWKFAFTLLYGLYRMSQELRSLLWDYFQSRFWVKNVIYTWVKFVTVQELWAFLKTVNKLERKEEYCAFIELCCQMYSYRFAVQHWSRLFEVSSVCFDTFSNLCDQRICNLTKDCSIVDASCCAENSLE